MLHKINPKVQRAVADAGLPVKAIRTRSRPWKDDGDRFDTLLELELEETVRQEGGKAEEALIIDGEPMFYSIMRGALQVRLVVSDAPHILALLTTSPMSTNTGSLD